MRILRINTYTRTIERIYNSLTDIDSEEFDYKKVLECCKGKIYAYGGKYSIDGCIWRYLNDMAYLKPNFDFPTYICGLGRVYTTSNESSVLSTIMDNENTFFDIEKDFINNPSSNIYKYYRELSIIQDYIPKGLVGRFDDNGNLLQLYTSVHDMFYNDRVIQNAIYSGSKSFGFYWSYL